HPQSFPTRRSSDLAATTQAVEQAKDQKQPDPVAPQQAAEASAAKAEKQDIQEPAAAAGQGIEAATAEAKPEVATEAEQPATAGADKAPGRRSRSEEHTSELQLRENLVCRLLLEKEK